MSKECGVIIREGGGGSVLGPAHWMTAVCAAGLSGLPRRRGV